MARNDGIDRTLARNQDLETSDDVAKVQEHNERKKDRYSNVDIVPERTPLNVHFKAPSASYTEMFEQLERHKVISTRGLKPDAVKYGELIFDVNSAYFYNHGGYEFAKQFYADAYKAAVEIVGGEQYILSAVMHADERNRAMSEALVEDVYHYHLHEKFCVIDLYTSIHGTYLVSPDRYLTEGIIALRISPFLIDPGRRPLGRHHRDLPVAA